MRDNADDLTPLGKIIGEAVNSAFDKFLHRQSKELGITPEELVQRLAAEIDQELEERRKIDAT